MKLISRKEINLESLKKSIFIYPTDTIYGIGCDATNEELVARIREIKLRSSKPFSVIAPSKKWIFEHFIIDKAGEWIDKLPGAYTLILKFRKGKENCVAENVSFSDTLGVRIPKHWISNVVSRLGFPIVTTSVNVSGEKNMESLEDLNDEIKKRVDYIIYEGKLSGKPSMIVELTGSQKIIKR